MNDRTEISATHIFFQAATDCKVDQANQSVDGFSIYNYKQVFIKQGSDKREI